MTSDKNLNLLNNSINFNVFTGAIDFHNRHSNLSNSLKHLTTKLNDYLNEPASISSREELYKLILNENSLILAKNLFSKAYNFDLTSKYIETAKNTVKFDQVYAVSRQLNKSLPLLPALDEKLTDKDYLIYTSISHTELPEKLFIDKFQGHFNNIFKAIEKAKSEHKQASLTKRYLGAIEKNQLNEFFYCLSRGININANTDEPVLTLAMRNNSTEIVNKLLLLGADIYTHHDENTPLVWAIKNQQISYLKLLLQKYTSDKNNNAVNDTLSHLDSYISDNNASGISEILLQYKTPSGI